MSNTTRLLAALLAPAALGTGLFAAEGLGSPAGASEPLRCEIRLSDQGDSVGIEGAVRAAVALDGRYRLTVSRDGASGTTAIDQSGEFSASPGEPARLGSVTLDNGGGPYEIRLTVTAAGQTVSCVKHGSGTL